MTHDHLEIELKYSVAGDQKLPPLHELQGVAAVDQPVAQDLVADYFDTEDLRLARLSITVRRRTGGDDAGWHVKVPTKDGRHELREPLTTDGGPPAAVLVALNSVLRRRPLRPVVTIATRRSAHRLRDAGGSVLAEVADDRVDARLTLPGVADTSWREWEVELVDGEADLVGRIAEMFEDAGAERASYSSKLARALGSDIAAPDDGPAASTGGEVNAAEVVRARLGEQLARLLRFDVLVRRDVEDSVHQMRVAVRRLRSALATFRPMFERDQTDPVRDELKWLASLLGEARDAEVLHGRIGDLAGEEDPALVYSRTIASVQEELTRRYRVNHDRVVQLMESPRYAALIDRLEQVAVHPPWSQTAQDPPPGVLRRRVRHDWKRVKAAVADAEEAPDADTRRSRLHEVRKAAKRARYAAEPLIPVHGKDAKRFAKAAKEVQSTLGDLNDAVVVMDELKTLAAREGARGHNAFTLGVLHTREQAAAAELENSFEGVWQAARRKKTHRWLK